jgi:GTP pyrophosphokinase
MHRIAESGIAAHWNYKEGGKQDADTDSKFAWLRQLLEWQKEMRDEDQFMENLKIDLFTDEVFVFTPKGDVINLQAGSTPIDFAYAIHSGVGNKMMGAKINGKIVPIDYVLRNGDIIEILTSPSVHGPSRDWLKIVKSSQARNKINQWFKKEKREENIVRGKEIVEKELKKMGISYNQLFKPEWVEILLKKYNLSNMDDIYASIGYGGILPQKVIAKLKEEYKKTVKDPAEDIFNNVQENNQQKPAKKKSPSNNGVVVKGVDNCLIRFSKCCNPVPGDEIIGYITRGRGVSIHRKDCINFKDTSTQKDRFIEVEWYKDADVSYQAEIQIMANDRNMLLMDITNCIGEVKIPIKAINARTTRDRIGIVNLTLEIASAEELEKIIKRLKRVEGVFEVSRAGRN